MENMQQQSMQAAMLKDIHNQRLGSLSSSSAASEKSKSHSDLSSIELGKFPEPITLTINIFQSSGSSLKWTAIHQTGQLKRIELVSSKRKN